MICNGYLCDPCMCIPMLPTMCTLAVYQCQQYIPVFTVPVPTIHTCVYRTSANNTYLCLPVPTIHTCVHLCRMYKAYLCIPIYSMLNTIRTCAYIQCNAWATCIYSTQRSQHALTRGKLEQGSRVSVQHTISHVLIKECQICNVHIKYIETACVGYLLFTSILYAYS